MTLKQRIVFSLTMSLILTTVMTGWVTLLNLGLGNHFISAWSHAFVLSWPAAATISFFVAPLVTRITFKMTPQ